LLQSALSNLSAEAGVLQSGVDASVQGGATDDGGEE
jgi:hypothetical protein